MSCKLTPYVYTYHSSTSSYLLFTRVQDIRAGVCLPCRRKKVMHAVFHDEAGWRQKFVHLYEKERNQARVTAQQASSR